MKDLRRSFELSANRAKYARRGRALMGLKTGAASWTYDVPGGQGYKFVRVVMGEATAGWTIALNPAGISDTGDAPIDMDVYADGRMDIARDRFNG